MPSAPKSYQTIYKPADALSGETTIALLLWFIVWAILEVLWRKKTVALKRINFIALALSVLLTFPPIGDLL